MAEALPYLTLGLGVYQTVQGQNVQQQAIAAAKEPRLSKEQQATLRTAGTSNIAANLAQRGLLDSSLYTGALTDLERRIGEAAAGAGTMGDVPGMLWQQALGLGQSGAGTIGNLAQLYMLQKLFGGGQGFTSTMTNPFAGMNLPGVSGGIPAGFTLPPAPTNWWGF